MMYSLTVFEVSPVHVISVISHPEKLLCFHSDQKAFPKNVYFEEDNRPCSNAFEYINLSSFAVVSPLKFFSSSAFSLPEPGEQDVDRRCVTRQDGDSQLSAQTAPRSAKVCALFHPKQTVQSHRGYWSPGLADVLSRLLYEHASGRPTISE